MSAQNAPLMVSRNCEPQPQGFTLVELLVTIAVASILLTIAVPSFSSFINSQRLRAAQSDIATMLLLARSEAIKRNGEVNVISETGGWGNGFRVEAGTTVIQRQSAFRNISVTNTSASTSLVYTNAGRLRNGASAFELERDAIQHCVRIDVSGMPATRKGACS